MLTIWGARKDRIWAAGNQGTLVHYDGAAWREVSGLNTTAKLTQVFGSDERNVWVVGHSGTARHWDGSTWTALDMGLSTNINSGFSSGPREVWFVGDLGLVAHHDGARLLPLDSGATSNLNAGVGLRGEHGYTCGQCARQPPCSTAYTRRRDRRARRRSSCGCDRRHL